jgi:ATP-binding cassette subfamily B protein
LVGPSGGGKSTLCHLIPRFYDITGGAILLDGIDIREIPLSFLRKNIGMVSQNVFLFDGTVKDNIAYGSPDATDEEIAEAAKKANIYEDIMALENGFDTHVGERGVKLSGGQKQRVAIARVFLKNPKLLILDEATSALDNATEMQVQAALEKLSVGRTVLVVAHRLSTIKEADRIVVLDKTGVLESGTHEELLAAGGKYKELYEYQFRGQ